MKPEDDCIDTERILSRKATANGNCRAVDNPVLEAMRRLWWQALDRVCGFFVLLRLSIRDCIYGPDPPTAADLEREADHERLVRAFPVVGEATERRDVDLRGAKQAD